MLVPAQLFAKGLDLACGIFHLPLNYNLTRKPGEEPITAYKNTVLIYNPRAGAFGRKGISLIERASEILTRQGHQVRVSPTTGPGTAGPIARASIEQNADLVVAAGGDGTINEVVEGMVHSTVPLAILPAGTANVLAAELRLGPSVERLVERLPEFQPHRISVGHLTCEGGRVARHFLLMAGIGLDAQIVYEVSAALKARSGKLAYWVAGAKMLGRRLPQLHAEIDGRKLPCSFALVSKVRNYGGDFEIARSVSLLDDEFEVVLFEGPSSLSYVKYVAGMATGRLAGMKGITILRATRISVSSGDRRAYAQVDGEFAGHLPAEVRLVPQALTVLLPNEYGGKGARRER